MQNINTTLHTNGTGYSELTCDLLVTHFEVSAYEDGECGELRAYIANYDADETGLVYGDELFLEELQNELAKLQLTASGNIDYSEEGLQGDSYVSFDITGDLLLQCVSKYNIEYM